MSEVRRECDLCGEAYVGNSATAYMRQVEVAGELFDVCKGKCASDIVGLGDWWQDQITPTSTDAILCYGAEQMHKEKDA